MCDWQERRYDYLRAAYERLVTDNSELRAMNLRQFETIKYLQGAYEDASASSDRYTDHLRDAAGADR